MDFELSLPGAACLICMPALIAHTAVRAGCYSSGITRRMNASNKGTVNAVSP